MPKKNIGYLIYEQHDSPDKVLSEDFNIEVGIISVTISPTTEVHRLASIRFKKTIKDLKSNKKKETFYMARVIFTYDLGAKVTEETRVKNPLSFKVVNYQVSPEMMEEGKK